MGRRGYYWYLIHIYMQTHFHFLESMVLHDGLTLFGDSVVGSRGLGLQWLHHRIKPMCGSLVMMSLGSLINVEPRSNSSSSGRITSSTSRGNKAIVPVFNELFYSSI